METLVDVSPSRRYQQMKSILTWAWVVHWYPEPLKPRLALTVVQSIHYCARDLLPPPLHENVHHNLPRISFPPE